MNEGKIVLFCFFSPQMVTRRSWCSKIALPAETGFRNMVAFSGTWFLLVKHQRWRSYPGWRRRCWSSSRRWPSNSARQGRGAAEERWRARGHKRRTRTQTPAAPDASHTCTETIHQVGVLLELQEHYQTIPGMLVENYQNTARTLQEPCLNVDRILL